jgi:hypothetical protein
VCWRWTVAAPLVDVKVFDVDRSAARLSAGAGHGRPGWCTTATTHTRTWCQPSAGPVEQAVCAFIAAFIRDQVAQNTAVPPVEPHPPRPTLRLHNGTSDLMSVFFQLQASFLLLIVDYLATFVT